MKFTFMAQFSNTFLFRLEHFRC